MQNIKIGTQLFHYLVMNKIGTVIDIVTAKNDNVWLTEGTRMTTKKAVVLYSDGSQETHLFGDLMRADLD